MRTHFALDALTEKIIGGAFSVARALGHGFLEAVYNNALAVIVELKVAEALSASHSAQVLNYLKASKLPVGLLFNFGKPRIDVRRVFL